MAEWPQLEYGKGKELIEDLWERRLDRWDFRYSATQQLAFYYSMHWKDAQMCVDIWLDEHHPYGGSKWLDH